jgi:hypothetical protein
MWATFLATGLFFALHRKQFHSFKKIIALILLIAVSTAFFKFYNTDSELEYKTSPALVKKGYITRKLILESGLQAWKEKPVFGYGPQNFQIAQRPYQTAEMNLYESWEFGWLKAHNHLLDLLVCQGLVGLILSVILYLYLLIGSIRIFFKKAHTEKDLFALASFAGYNFLYISNLTAFNMIPTQMLYTIFPVLFSIGTDQVRLKNIHLKPFVRMFALVACFIISANLLFSTYRVWKADILTQRWSKNPSFKADRVKSIELALEAISYNPSEPIYYCFAGQLYNEMLVHNFKTLKTEDTRKALDAIDENMTECMNRGSGVDYLIRLSAEVYAELYFQGVIASPERALELYGQMEKITPQSPKPVLEIARLQLKAGHPEEFIKLMNEALTLKADYLPAYIELVNYYYNAKDIDSVWLLADQLSKVEFYSPQFVPFIQDLVIIANQNGDIRSKNIFQAVYEKFKYLIPPPMKIAK